MLLDGTNLNQAKISSASRGKIPHIAVDPHCLSVRNSSSKIYKNGLKNSEVYGGSTGLGARKTEKLDLGYDLRETISATATYTNMFGSFSPSVTRAMLVCQINSLLSPSSSASPELIKKLVNVYNNYSDEELPLIPAISNSTGDLNSAAFFAKWWLDQDPDFKLKPGEDLLLIAGNHYTDALSAILKMETENLMNIAYMTFGMSAEAFRLQISALDTEVAQTRPLPKLEESIEYCRDWLEGSRLMKKGENRLLQDPSSFRSFPQVAATVEHQLDELGNYSKIELNSFSQNPLISVVNGEIIHNANFDTTQHSVILSALNIALAKFADLSFKRLSKLCDPHFNGALDGFGNGDHPKSGLQSRNLTNIAGLALGNIVHDSNKNLSSSLSVVFQNGIEDSVENTLQQLQNTANLLVNLRALLACELLTAVAGVDYRLKNGELSEGDIAPALLKVYHAVKHNLDYGQDILALDQVLDCMDNQELFRGRKMRDYETADIAERILRETESDTTLSNGSKFADKVQKLSVNKSETRRFV